MKKVFYIGESSDIEYSLAPYCTKSEYKGTKFTDIISNSPVDKETVKDISFDAIILFGEWIERDMYGVDTFNQIISDYVDFSEFDNIAILELK